MNENETGATVNYKEGNNDAVACQSAATGGNSNSDLFGDSNSDDSISAQGGTTATAVSTGNGAAKAAVHAKVAVKQCHSSI